MIEIILCARRLEGLLSQLSRMMASQIPSNGIAVKHDKNSPVHKAVKDVQTVVDELKQRLADWK